jgi:hypothetical protein
MADLRGTSPQLDKSQAPVGTSATVGVVWGLPVHKLLRFCTSWKQLGDCINAVCCTVVSVSNEGGVPYDCLP